MSRPRPPVSPRTIDPSNAATYIPKPPLNFTGTAKSLESIVKEHQLPRVIQCDQVNAPTKEVMKSNLDITQPLLAYMFRSVRKVCAHSLQFDDQKRDFITVGDGLLIPEDYPGWFAVMGTINSVTKSQQAIPHYNKLSCLAMSRCKHFLVGGNDCLRGAMIERAEDGTAKKKPCQILPGTVLRRAGLYREEVSAIKEKKKKKKTKKVQELPHHDFLKCYDEYERELFIHTHQEGVFYVISKDDQTVSPQILQMKDILARLSLPLVVKLLYGRVPTTPCGFMQVMLLTDCGLSSTLVASTLLCYRNINFEIPLGTDIKFRVASDTPALRGSRAYVNALNMCKDKALSYIRDMKVVFGNPQLRRIETPRANTASDQQAKSTEINKSQPRPDVSAAARTPPMAEVASGVDKVDSEHLPEQSAKKFSQTSYLQRMSTRIIENRESFILAEHPLQQSSPIKPRESKTLQKLESTNSNKSANMEPITTYEPPKHYVISNTKSNSWPPAANKQVVEVQIEYQRHSKSVNAFNSRKTDSISSSELPLIRNNSDRIPQNQTNADSNSDGSTITIPSKPGQPVRSPAVHRKQDDYIKMTGHKNLPMTGGHKNLPKPCHISQLDTVLSTSIPPKPPERRVQPKYSESSSIPDSDSLTSVSDDSWSISEGTDVDDENIYVNMDFHNLKRIESEPSEGGQEDYVEFQPYEHSFGGCITQQVMPQPRGCSNALTGLQPTWQQTNIKKPVNEYLVASDEPLNVYLEPLDDPNQQQNFYEHANEQAGVTSVHGYTMLDSGSEGLDSGICEDESCYSSCSDSQSIAPGDYGPQLPPRGPPISKPINLGQAVLRSIPGPSTTTFGQANKDALIEELKKAGIKSATELALKGLQLADIVNLLSEDENLDDVLIDTLPQVGHLDLKKIAACLRGMKPSRP